MKKFRKIISIALSLSIVTALSGSTYGNSVMALEMTKKEKLSSVLLEELDELKADETVPVYVEMEDIKQDTVEQKVNEQTGMTLAQLEAIDKKLLKSDELENASNEELETLLPKYFKDTEGEREYVQGLVNERIAAERKIAKEMYDEQNSEYVEKTGIDETDVEFVSSYSPMVITECTEDEIDDIVVNGKVKSIDIREDIEISENTEADTTEESGQAASTYSSYTTAWKSAINADMTTNTIGIKGKGVTIGVYDGDSLYKNYYDLKNTDLTSLDKVIDYEDYHCTKVTRILAGSKGIVPKAKVFEWSDNNVTREEIIEKLIEKGVSIINMSLAFGERTEDYYTTFEKWLDHIGYRHHVLLVVSAGNTDMYDSKEQCPVGTLSYNTLTVGGIDTKNTDKFSDDKFHSGSCFGNGGSKGCAKPDCVAAYNDVLEETLNFNGDKKLIYDGTSFAAPAVTGVCAQVLQTEPTLAFYPQQIKAIIMASCDRKGSESYASGLTAKEGSGVVNAFKAIVIASTERYSRKLIFPYDGNPTKEINFVKRESSSKIAICWLTPSFTYGDDLSGNAESNGNYDFNLSVYSSKGSLLKQSNVYNSSAEVVVFNSENDTLELSFKDYYMYTNSAYEIGIAWY